MATKQQYFHVAVTNMQYYHAKHQSVSHDKTTGKYANTKPPKILIDDVSVNINYNND